MSNEVLAKCDICGSDTKYGETCYAWFRRFVKVLHCNFATCESKAFCLICKKYIIRKKGNGYPLTYFKHILSHYGLNEDYDVNLYSVTCAIDNVCITPSNAYIYLPQLLFVSIEQITKHRYLELTDIQHRMKDSSFSCLICDTFYETFPTLEVVVSHLMKVHMDSSGEPVELPPLIDFIRNVNFK